MLLSDAIEKSGGLQLTNGDGVKLSVIGNDESGPIYIVSGTTSSYTFTRNDQVRDDWDFLGYQPLPETPLTPEEKQAQYTYVPQTSSGPTPSPAPIVESVGE